MNIPEALNKLLFSGGWFWLAVGLDFLFVASTVFSVLYSIVMLFAALTCRKIQRYSYIIPFLAAMSLIAAFSPIGCFAASIWKGLFSHAVSLSSVRWFPAVPLFLWVAVAIAALVRFVFAYVKVSATARDGIAVEDGTAFSRAIASALPGGEIRLAEVEIDSPAAWGMWRKRILVPPDFIRSHTEEERVQIYLHELSHHRSGDVLWTLAANVCGCVFWFHPIILRAIASFLESLEIACDWRLVNRYGVDATAYSKTILKMQAGFARKTLLPHFPGSGNEVKTRIFYLNDRVSRLRGLMSSYLPALLCVAAGFTLFLASGKEVPGEFDAFTTDLHVEIPDGTERKLDVTFYWSGATAIFSRTVTGPQTPESEGLQTWLIYHMRDGMLLEVRGEPEIHSLYSGSASAAK